MRTDEGFAHYKTVSICDTQPVMAEGVKALLGNTSDLRFLESCDSLGQATALLHCAAPDVLLLDKAVGAQFLRDWLTAWERPGTEKKRTAIVVWGTTVTDLDASRFLQSGVQGVIRKTARPSELISCIRAAAAGQIWVEPETSDRPRRPEGDTFSALTLRERQVLSLVERGFTNKEIGSDLGICTGTVKIHLKHIFGKTGLYGRHELTLTRIRDRAVASLPS
jgi:DNA-binding NarL/FixJ family response regulator